MVTVSEYRATIFDLIRPLRRTRVVPLAACAGRTLVLAEDVHSGVDVPPFDNSQMDGFAVSSADIVAGPADDASVTVPLMPMITAGVDAEPLLPGHAAPIMTGARLPSGADSVIPVEESLDGFDRTDAVTFTHARSVVATTGRFVRDRGTDTSAGARIGRAGQILTPALAGVFASCGLAEAPVLDPLRVLIVSTGDEVVEPGTERGPAQIFDANGIAVSAALAAAGAHVLATIHISDSPADLFDAISRARAAADGVNPAPDGVETGIDLVVSMGGISQGAKEIIRLAAAEESRRQPTGSTASTAPDEHSGASGMTFTGVGMQPGGPQGYGTLAGLPWVALPGNPVSSLVSIEMFVRPALLDIPPDTAPRPVFEGRLSLPDGPQSSPAGKLQVRRAHLHPDSSVELISGPSSHLLAAYAQANALALVGAQTTEIADGDTVVTWSIA